jgi:homoserine O-succinyltransferase
MPLVAHSQLPSFSRLRETGLEVLDPDRAAQQDVRELHIGLLNMMPDAALEATERQFMRLMGSSNRIAQFYVHPFTIEGVDREGAVGEHVENYYEDFGSLQRDGLDALIITGANVTEADITKERFWEPMTDVMDWARENVTSTLCSCLTTHAVLDFRYGQRREKQRSKKWGVFRHRVVDSSHPLVSDVNTEFDVPHSRWNTVHPQQFEAAGLKILVAGDDGSVHLATSPDGFRGVFFQGHPEYDTVSLLKEYKRDVNLYIQGKFENYAPMPDNYFDEFSAAVLREYEGRVDRALQQGAPLPEFPEHLVVPHCKNTWQDTATAVVGTWVGLVYQITNLDRHQPFMPGVSADNPLGL